MATAELTQDQDYVEQGQTRYQETLPSTDHHFNCVEVWQLLRSNRRHQSRSYPSRSAMKEKLQQKWVRWIRVAIGGPMGLVAWSISGASAAAIIIWGLKTVALPLLMLKTASWGIWGVGVIKESKLRKLTKRQ